LIGLLVCFAFYKLYPRNTRMAEQAKQFKDAVGDTAESLKEKGKDAGCAVGDKAGEWKDAAVKKGGECKESAGESLEKGGKKIKESVGA